MGWVLATCPKRTIKPMKSEKQRRKRQTNKRGHEYSKKGRQTLTEMGHLIASNLFGVKLAIQSTYLTLVYHLVALDCIPRFHSDSDISNDESYNPFSLKAAVLITAANDCNSDESKVYTTRDPPCLHDVSAYCHPYCQAVADKAKHKGAWSGRPPTHPSAFVYINHRHLFPMLRTLMIPALHHPPPPRLPRARLFPWLKG